MLQPTEMTAAGLCSLVGGFHDARPSARDHGEACFGQEATGLHGGIVHRIVGRGARGAEDGDAATDRCECIHTLDEFRGDAHHAPRIRLGVILLGRSRRLQELLVFGDVAVGKIGRSIADGLVDLARRAGLTLRRGLRWRRSASHHVAGFGALPGPGDRILAGLLEKLRIYALSRCGSGRPGRRFAALPGRRCGWPLRGRSLLFRRLFGCGFCHIRI